MAPTHVETLLPTAVVADRLARQDARTDWGRLLRAVGPPCEAELTVFGWSRVRIRPELVSVHAEALRRTRLLHHGFDPRRALQLHALLGLIFELACGSADALVGRLDSRSRAVLEQLARSEGRAPDGALLRSLFSSATLAVLLDCDAWLAGTDRGRAASVLHYLLAIRRERPRPLPETLQFGAFLQDLERAVDRPADFTSSRDPRPALINALEELLLGKGDVGDPDGARLIVDESPVEGEQRAAVLELHRALQRRARPAEESTRFCGSASSDEPTRYVTPPLDTASSAMPERLGDWTIEKELGAGGMGRVYLARDRQGRPAAIKTLLAESGASTEQMHRFLREIEVLLKLDHPSVIRCLDYLVEAPRCFLVLELCEGGTLTDLLGRSRRLGPMTTWRLVAELAGALDHALNYSKQFIHRDLKSSNVLLDRYGYCRLADFGLAAGLASHATRFTQPGVGMGTVPFMAPEQIEDVSGVDTRADLWSLGVVAWRCLTGRMPFTGKTHSHVLRSIQRGRLDFESSRVQRLSEWSRETLRRLLAHERDDRFQTPRELLDHIAARPLEWHSGAAGAPVDRLMLDFPSGHRLFVVAADELTLGRSSRDVDLCLRPLPAKDFDRDLDRLSNRHARIRFDGRLFQMQDTSRNGTAVDAEAIGEGRAVALHNGAAIDLALALDLEASTLPGGLVLGRPVNWPWHASLMLARRADLDILLARFPGWPRPGLDLVRTEQGPALYTRPETAVNGKAVPPGRLVVLRPGMTISTRRGACEVRAWSMDAMKRPTRAGDR